MHSLLTHSEPNGKAEKDHSPIKPLGCLLAKLMLNHSLENFPICSRPLKEADFASPLRNNEADDEEMVDMGEGFNFLARLFRMYCPLGLATTGGYSFLSLFSSAYSLMQ
jgi:hypothetical protein